MREVKINGFHKDNLFKELFGNEKNITVVTSFLSDYLEIPYEELDGNVRIINSALPMIGDEVKQKTVDIVVRLENRVINIEMNYYKKSSTIMRNFQYLMNIILGDIKTGEEYNTQTQYLQINFNNFAVYKGAREREIFYFQNEINRKLIENVRIDHIDMRKCRETCYNENEIGAWVKILTSHTMEELLMAVGDSKMEEKSKSVVIDITEAFSKDVIDRLYYDPEKEMEKMVRTEMRIELEREFNKKEKKFSKREKEYNKREKEYNKREKEYNKREKEYEKREKEYEKKIKDSTSHGALQERTSIVKGMIEEGLDASLISKITGLSMEDINIMMKST